MGIVGYYLLVKHLNGLKGRQIYTKLTDKEVELFDEFLRIYKLGKSDFIRKVILSSLKKHALLEKQKRKEEKK